MIPKEWLDAPTPSEAETLRTFALLAVGARGALTEPAIREHWRLRIRKFTPEPKVRGNVDARLEQAAARLARVLGLERVEQSG